MKRIALFVPVALFAACGSSELIAADIDPSKGDGAVTDGAGADGAIHGDLDGSSSDGAGSTDGRGASFVVPFLGAAAHFTVVAGGTVTNANMTTITGDVGVYPLSTPIGPTPPVVIGSTFLGTPESLAAENAMTTAYNQLAAEPCGTNLTGLDLGGMTLAPGVYCFDSSAQLTGTLTLDGRTASDFHGWVFQIGSSLTTASAAAVTVINGGNLCDAYWKVGSSATLGTGTNFGGSIIAMASITLTTGSTVVGRVLGRTGSVTLDTNTVSVASCPGAVPADGGD